MTGRTRGKDIGGPTLVVGAPDEPEVAKRVRQTSVRGKLSVDPAGKKLLPVQFVGDEESNELDKAVRCLVDPSLPKRLTSTRLYPGVNTRASTLSNQ